MIDIKQELETRRKGTNHIAESKAGASPDECRGYTSPSTSNLAPVLKLGITTLADLAGMLSQAY